VTHTSDPHAAARRLAALDLHEHLGDPARKQAFVTPMFDVIAPRYDRFTRWFSFGMDRRWKRAAIDALATALPPGASVLDVATGTGDLADAAVAHAAAGDALGIDASPAMIHAATDRHATAPALRFAVASVMALPLRDAQYGGATAGYAFRNVPALSPALAECARVLRPGAPLVILDFYRPANRLWAWLFVTYLRVAGNVVGWCWHRAPVVYGYLGPSVAGWVTVPQMTTALGSAGFTVRRVQRWLGGGVALHVATRHAPSSPDLPCSDS
jgi:demethylmenaquinone methyltransferase / 2-methoxy-6-polyprenyl-1,4-benzoquinol methylase